MYFTVIFITISFCAESRGNYCPGVELDGRNTQMLTSGTLKSGESFFCSTTPLHLINNLVFAWFTHKSTQSWHVPVNSCFHDFNNEKSFSVIKMHKYAANFKRK